MTAQSPHLGSRPEIAGASVVAERLPESRVGFTIEVPSEGVDEAYRRALQRLAQRVRIGGFRPGRAPLAMVEARVGPAVLREDVVDLLVPPLVTTALQERALEAVDRPQVEVQELSRGQPARLVARVSVMPEVTLPDLDHLQVERPTLEVSDRMVEVRLEALRERLAEIEPVERAVRAGDVVVADLQVAVEGAETPAETRTAVELHVAEGRLPAPVLEALPGRAEGERALAEVTLPDDHPDPDLRGRRERWEITVRGVKEKRLPELTDGLAERMSDGAQHSLDELRRALREELEGESERSQERLFEQRVIKAVVEAAAVEVPRPLVERELARRMDDLEHRLVHQGLRLDRYLGYVDKTAEEYRAELEPEVEDRLRAELVLDAVAQKLELVPDQQAVGEYLRAEAGEDPELRGRVAELEASDAVRRYFRDRLARRRALAALKSRLGDHPAGAAKGS